MYFDQQTHACACIGMVDNNNKKRSKIIKNILFSSCIWGALIVTRGPCAKLVEITLNLSGVTSFWVSTSIWESLLNAKKLHFSSYFYVGLTWASRTHEEILEPFFIIFDHANTCASIPSLVEIHNARPICKRFQDSGTGLYSSKNVKIVIKQAWSLPMHLYYYGALLKVFSGDYFNTNVSRLNFWIRGQSYKTFEALGWCKIKCLNRWLCL